MNAPDLPRISLVTPSFNQAAFLERTLRSALDQNYPNLQYVVVDGGSTDGSVDILRRYADRLDDWLSEPDAGQADAINKGFARADGEILTWLNSDDLLLPGALDRVGRIFARYPEIAWLTGRATNIDAGDRQTSIPVPNSYFRALIRRGWYHGRGLGFIRQEGTFWRRSLWDQTGAALDRRLHYALDFDLWRRFAEHADLVTVTARLAAYRVHPAQKTASLAPYYAEMGLGVPAWVRALALPVRAASALLAWPLTPRVTFRDGEPHFTPGPFFRA